MKQTILRVEATFIEPLLATASGNPELHAEFIAARVSEDKAQRNIEDDAKKIAEEAATLPVGEQLEKASTVFHRDESGLFLYDYTWRGFIKEGVQSFMELGEFKLLNPWNYRKAVDGAVFVTPRRIYLCRVSGDKIIAPDGTLQRPLRALTMQGERIALARSEYVKEGTKCQFQVLVLESSKAKSSWSEITAKVITECLKAGERKGHGQWRTGGYGKFECTVTEHPAT